MNVVIVGGSHHNTLGVIRSLGRKGVRPKVILTAGNGSWVLKSKYIDTFEVVNSCEEAIELLLKKYAKKDERTVLIACHDPIASQFDINRERLVPYFFIPGTAEQGRVTFLMNKQKMALLAEEIGLNVPKTIVLNKSSDKEKEGIPFPCIMKPIESKNGSKDEIKIFQEEISLIEYLKKKDKGFLVQQFVEKDFEFQLIGCSTNFGKEIIIPGVSIILRQPFNTNTGFLHYTQFDDSYKDTIQKTKSFIQKIGYSGLFSVEFLRDKKGIDYFMEINFRNDGNSIAVTNAGVNLPYIWCLSCLGIEFNDEIKQIHDEWVMPEFSELGLYSSGYITFRQLKKDMKKATSYMDFASDDVAPTNGWKNYRKQLLIAPLRVLKNRFKRK